MGSYNYKGPVVRLWGRNPATNTTFENLNAVSNLVTYSGLGAAAKLQVSSSSTDDDGSPVGTGALTLKIIGLNAAYVLQEETVTLNGQTAVETAATFLRVFAAYVVTAGTGLTNAGDIYVYKTGQAITSGVPNALTTTWVKIAIGYGGDTSGMITVPAGKMYEMRSFYGAARAQATDVAIFTHDTQGTDSCPKQEFTHTVGTNGFGIEFPQPKDPSALSPLRYGEKVDIYLRALSGSANGVVSAEVVFEEVYPSR